MLLNKNGYKRVKKSWNRQNRRFQTYLNETVIHKNFINFVSAKSSHKKWWKLWNQLFFDWWFRPNNLVVACSPKQQSYQFPCTQQNNYGSQLEPKHNRSRDWHLKLNTQTELLGKLKSCPSQWIIFASNSRYRFWNLSIFHLEINFGQCFQLIAHSCRHQRGLPFSFRMALQARKLSWFEDSICQKYSILIWNLH